MEQCAGDNVKRDTQQSMMKTETVDPVHDGSQEGQGTAEYCKRRRSDTDRDGARDMRFSESGATVVAPKPSSQAGTDLVKHDVQPRDRPPNRMVSISVCTSSPESSVQGLLDLLRSWQSSEPIREVKFHPLPYNDIDDYKFKSSDPVDVMILCHSIFNRRFAITDIADALYDKYLKYCSKVIGKGKMAVIVHDFSTTDGVSESSREEAFRSMQPKTFDTTSLAITCGNLEKEPEIRQEHRESLREFISTAAAQYPPEMKPKQRAAQYPWEMPDFITKSSSFTSCWGPTACYDPITHVATTMTHRTVTQPVVVQVCACADEASVQTFMRVMDGLKECDPEIIRDVKFRRLPYNDIDSFRFPSSPPFDVLLLCHAIHDRQLDIYDKFLQYCSQLYGKKHLALIIHGVDFKDVRELEAKLHSLRAAKPLAFDLVSEVIVCGRLDEGFAMRAEDTEKLLTLLQRTQYRQPVTFEPSIHASKRMEEQVPGTKVVTSQPLDHTPEPPEIASGTTAHTIIKSASHSSQMGIVGAEYSTDSKQIVTRPPPKSENLSQYAGHSPQPMSLPSGTINRQVSVSLCTSASPETVTALKSALQNVSRDSPGLIGDVRVRRLPYNDIDAFYFPASDPVDVMVLCHSITNRGFGITDVTNALYEKYLTYCNKVIGREKLAVIVHDFQNLSSDSRVSRMNTFKNRQPKTFQLVDTVIMSGCLGGDHSMEESDLDTLVKFLRKARLQPRRNYQEGRLDSMKSWVRRKKNDFF